MIDPFTAFALAQGAVKGIKAAIALGKDINGLYKEFSSFYQNADAVHIASTKMKIDNIGKSDAQINAQALEIAMASKALRDHEKELKDILFWSGNAQVWEEMMAERTRMTKERNAAEKAIADKKQRDRETMAEIVMTTLYFLGGLSIVVPVIWGTFHLVTNKGF
jgi:Fe2+ transport system protein B